MNIDNYSQFNTPKKEEERGSKEKTHDSVDAFLILPERIGENNNDRYLGKKLGNFLVDEDYIKDIKIWHGSWGFKYKDKEIAIAENEMSEENYKYYIFRLGVNSKNGECLYPKLGDETDQYRFLHETNHAYQDYLINKESRKNNIDSVNWHNKAVVEELDSNFSLLFKFCYENRKNNYGKGLSTWGNVPDYNSIENQDSQNAIRAIEDANEMVTMYMWHPEYLETFLNYVSLNIPEYKELDLDKDGFTKISNQERESLKALIEMYIEEMKTEINS